ncbi:hypothetical protein DSO57_1034154 [Entomophthora muscae]|uniref:Uncharacterized protein n=1 Tax=Entomophthora muscae TaxID=34485 RepID=A0ACC2UJU1_9FUNG|nr:hypothetical protein DSO57_1034154 [Entomophthora muscae]
MFSVARVFSKPVSGLRVPLLRSFSTRSAVCSEARLNSLYTLSEEEQMLKTEVARFANDKVKPLVQEMDENETLDKGILKGLFDAGLMGIETPVEYGGSGGSFMSAILTVEELAKIDPSISVICDVQNTLVNTLFRKFGSKHLKEKYLARLATDTVGCFGLSEANSGSDAFALKTRAVKDGSHYIITGSKLWITNSGEADIFLVFANADPSAGYKGITCFVLDRDMGVQVSAKEKKLGIRCSSTCGLTFDGIMVPEENILGEYGKGYKYAIEILNEGRIGIAAQMVGLAQGVFDMTLPYLFERQQFGEKIGEFQGMQHQYAQAATEIEAARLLTYNAARLKDEGQPFLYQSTMAKLYASQIAQKVSSQCIDWMGGVGFTREYPIEKFYRDSKIGTIYEGTSNIQLSTIAKNLAKRYS